MLLDVYRTPGTFIGEQEAIIDKPFSSTVCNTTPVKLFKITNNDLKLWLKRDADFCFDMLRNQAEQVYHLSKRTGHYALYNAKEQVVLRIIAYYRKEKIITKHDIINTVATSPRHVNRILSDLVNQKIIKIKGVRIDVLNIDELIRYKER